MDNSWSDFIAVLRAGSLVIVPISLVLVEFSVLVGLGKLSWFVASLRLGEVSGFAGAALYFQSLVRPPNALYAALGESTIPLGAILFVLWAFVVGGAGAVARRVKARRPTRGDWSRAVPVPLIGAIVLWAGLLASSAAAK